MAQTASSVTVGPTATVVTTDGLDCPGDTRQSFIGTVAEGFRGHATPEDAVRSIASLLPIEAKPKHLEGDDWIVETEDGRAVAKTRVEPWEEGWFASELLACGEM